MGCIVRGDYGIYANVKGPGSSSGWKRGRAGGEGAKGEGLTESDGRDRKPMEENSFIARVPTMSWASKRESSYLKP